MGLEIKKNSKDLYQMRSSISGEIIHTKKWVTQDEAKATLIERAFWDFVEKTIEIDHDFPEGYGVDGQRVFTPGKKRGCEIILEFLQKQDEGKSMYKAYKEILKKHKIKL